MTSLTAGALGVWGRSRSDVFVVGGDDTILHYDGKAWSSITSPTKNHLYGIWGSSISNIFAVGKGGTILHYDGKVWSNMASPTEGLIRDVWGLPIRCFRRWKL
jgi:hypothetical protein